ncbi:hypothetical protein DFH08DRAFT_1018590 [Mycena albidolilacea]|uniref:DUF6534 domain-containing protein n=1 Tax=Mycena albidolilacea TaxID=1033008 RepID=A0AAD7ELL7_9AGAR|nr:hypothetical protein DFH08DRAFT_1018590 [Mycena albidolilacea]
MSFTSLNSAKLAAINTFSKGATADTGSASSSYDVRNAYTSSAALRAPRPAIQGAYQIGASISYALFGVTTMQTYIYYSRFPDDSRKLKSLVALVWASKLGHVLCVGHALYFFTKPGSLGSPLTFDVAFIISAFIVACVQGFFGFRILLFSKRLYIPAVVWIVACVRLGVSVIAPICVLLASAVKGGMAPATQEAFFTSGCALVVFNDSLITIAMVFLIRRHRTDALESAVAIVQMICFLALPGSWIWIAFSSIEARAFANSFLANLNGRTTLRAMGDAPLTFAVPTMESSSGGGLQMANPRQNASDAEIHPKDETRRF